MVLNRNPPPAKRPSSYFHERFGFATLYLDDLDAVERYLSTRCESVQIAAGRATADSASDLVSATPKELESLRLETRSPAITVTLAPEHSGVATWEDSDRARTLVRDVSALLHGHQSTGAFILHMGPVALLVPLSTLSLLVLVIPAFSDPALWNQVLTWTLLVVGFGFLTWLNVRTISRRWRHGGVLFRRRTRSEVDGARRPNIVLAVVSIASAVAGGAVTAFIQWMLTGEPGS
ncbi:hypothetical protein LQ938_09735 [Microbacterium sp. cx-55]|uniref:hypothetical protein n=1 Tax=Microbacterium sp. cx-55 TaxID=2875948 RepID=UPI001CBBEBDE|nr:hypothetical protein [Microbacterium sp. cx-55]MBZ4485958.1 hypothetical protein [Microbacterium sp. cx-55]UGB34168.1 hypothetical protein LQ938_09735 [Microbacterium sp. cx-55]